MINSPALKIVLMSFAIRMLKLLLKDLIFFFKFTMILNTDIYVLKDSPTIVH